MIDLFDVEQSVSLLNCESHHCQGTILALGMALIVLSKKDQDEYVGLVSNGSHIESNTLFIEMLNGMFKAVVLHAVLLEWYD